MCPDYSKKEDHEVILVKNENMERCMEKWVDSQLVEVGSLLRSCRVKLPRPGT